jgi:hypothetical protein
MAFIKDKHSFTRGPGAIAAFDAVRRRGRTVVRSNPGMDRRPSARAVQRHGCMPGCIQYTDANGNVACDCDVLATPSARMMRGLGAIQVDDGGGGGGGGGVPTPPRRPRAAQIGQITPTFVKYPGVPAPIPPKSPTGPMGSTIGTRPPASTTYPPLHPPAPQRPPTVSTSGGATAVSSPVVQIPEAMEDEPDEFPNITLPATEAAPPAKSSKTLLIAAAAVGGLWLLLRR